MTYTGEERNLLRLPVPRSFHLRNFSLYRNLRSIDVSFEKGVFCLAGANGLGKSTFLNTLNYAITGVVAEPERKFFSLPEYYRNTKPYAREYFNGRVKDDDRAIASVQVAMTVGSKPYIIERGFETGELISLSIDGRLIENADTMIDGIASAERDSVYKRNIVSDSGLASFEQLVFLQHFLLTFDEQHRLLLWDDDTIEQTLLLAFGVDPSAAERADLLRRTIDRYESQARNLQYQATTAKNKLRELVDRATEDSSDEEETIDQPSLEEIERERGNLVRRLTTAQELVARESGREAAATSAFATAEQVYETAYRDLLHGHPFEHPLILDSAHADRCEVCSSEGARTRIAQLRQNTCWLCNAPLDSVKSVAVSDLEEISAQLERARSEMQYAQAALTNANAQHSKAESELSRFDIALEARANRAVYSADPLLGRLQNQYKAEADEAQQGRDEYRRKRDSLSKQLRPVSRELAQKFADSEDVFIPALSELAHEFLGLDTELFLQQRKGKPRLVVRVEGTERRTFDQLSESQRYFLDIALRMAIVGHMTGGHDLGCLLIDTPEGSLDIAYEARAGRMFGLFARQGHKIIMTANINTSRLLTSLATVCGPELMHVEPMTSWTRLSEVQSEGEDLFALAFRELFQILEA